MQKVQLIQATLLKTKERSDKLLYLVHVEPSELQPPEAGSEDGAVSAAISLVQSTIANAFQGSVVLWEAPMDFEMPLPDYDPLYRMEGIRVWIMPVVTKNESYFYLVG